MLCISDDYYFDETRTRKVFVLKFQLKRLNMIHIGKYGCKYDLFIS